MQASLTLDPSLYPRLPPSFSKSARRSGYPSNTAGLLEKVDRSGCPPAPLYPSPPMSKSPTPPTSFTTPSSSSNALALPTSRAATGSGIATSSQDYPHYHAGQVGHARRLSIQTSGGALEDDRSGRAPHYQSSQPNTPSVCGPPQHPPRFEAAPYLSESIHYGSAAAAPTALPPTPRPMLQTRRTKTHVQSACYNCKKAHLSCDVNRPCNRCVSSGKQDSCFDVEHKKRGRPRLRDERGNKVASGSNRQAQRSPQAVTPVVAAPSPSQLEPRPADSLHILRSQDVEQAARQGHYYPQMQHPPDSPYSQSIYSHPPDTSQRYLPQPIAFLDMDLKIARTNHVFRNLFAQGIELHAKHLEMLVDQSDRIALQDLRRQLRDERDTSDPEFMSPIVTALDLDKIPPVEAVDLQRISQGFGDHPVPLRFRFPDNQYASMIVSLRLAKADVYFVSITLPHVADTNTYQHAPYPPLRQGYQAYAMPPQYGLSPSFAPHQQYQYGSGSNVLPSPRTAGASSPQSSFYNFQNVASSLPSSTPTGMTQTRGGYDASYFYSPMPAPAGPSYGYSQGNTGQSNTSPHDYRQPSGYSSAQYPQQQGAPWHDSASSGVQLPPIGPAHPQVRQYSQALEPPNPSQRRGVTRRRETEALSEEDDPGRKRQRLNLREILD